MSAARVCFEQWAGREAEEGEGPVVMFGRSSECEAVLERYGLKQSSMAVVGADRLPEFPEWRVMVTGGERPEYLEIAVAVRLVLDLQRIGETRLA